MRSFINATKRDVDMTYWKSPAHVAVGNLVEHTIKLLGIEKKIPRLVNVEKQEVIEPRTQARVLGYLASHTPKTIKSTKSYMG